MDDLAQRQAATPVMRRRSLLAAAAAAGLGSVVGVAGLPRPARAQTALTPEAAMSALFAGNQRFAAGQPRMYREDAAELRAKTAEKQEPFAAVLSCADSRVPTEDIFDVSIGHIFVCRIAGNIATREIIASLEYGVAELGCRALLVLGHAGCGAVSAALKNANAPGQIPTLYPSIQAAIAHAGSDLAGAVKANAQYQARFLGTESPVVADAVKTGKLVVGSGYYDLVSGKVTRLS
jgi:carbonic anhydrase